MGRKEEWGEWRNEEEEEGEKRLLKLKITKLTSLKGQIWCLGDHTFPGSLY